MDVPIHKKVFRQSYGNKISALMNSGLEREARTAIALQRAFANLLRENGDSADIPFGTVTDALDNILGNRLDILAINHMLPPDFVATSSCRRVVMAPDAGVQFFLGCEVEGAETGQPGPSVDVAFILWVRVDQGEADLQVSSGSFRTSDETRQALTAAINSYTAKSDVEQEIE